MPTRSITVLTLLFVVSTVVVPVPLTVHRA
jgi:hypothetical protein